MFSTILMVLQVLSAVVLIILVMSQATKNEGLQGTIGGKSESVFQGKPGIEERISETTKWAAISFLVLSAVLFYAR